MANNKYNFNEIIDIYSHPQALAQCRNYIQKNFKNVNIHPISSTALAAKEVKNKDNCACIANKSCIEEYGLFLLGENIQDNDLNETKFWVLSKNMNENGEKMSLIFSTKNKPGALYKILGLFNEFDINLTKEQSVKVYRFLFDIKSNKTYSPLSYTKQELFSGLKPSKESNVEIFVPVFTSNNITTFFI